MVEKLIPVETGPDRQCQCGHGHSWEDYEEGLLCECGRVLVMVDSSADMEMHHEAREAQYKEKAYQALLDEREELLRRVKNIETDLDTLGFDVRLLEDG